uniref:Uncharacterized protein n=1 Tax=Steinernema glaseri TaxID=37863 RepID=A0A1I8ADT3_9BILA
MSIFRRRNHACLIQLDAFVARPSSREERVFMNRFTTSFTVVEVQSAAISTNPRRDSSVDTGAAFGSRVLVTCFLGTGHLEK